MPKFGSIVYSTPENVDNAIIRRDQNGDFSAGTITANLNGRANIAETFTHEQNSAAAVWNINHNLNKHPSVTVVDSSGQMVLGVIEYTDNNNVVLTFSGAFSGEAYLN